MHLRNSDAHSRTRTLPSEFGYLVQDAIWVQERRKSGENPIRARLLADLSPRPPTSRKARQKAARARFGRVRTIGRPSCPTGSNPLISLGRLGKSRHILHLPGCSGSCVRSHDGGFGNAQRGANLACAEIAAVQQLQSMSNLAHGDPWCGHSWVPVNKTGQPTPRLGHSEHCWGVRLQNGMLSAITVEQCPR